MGYAAQIWPHVKDVELSILPRITADYNIHVVTGLAHASANDPDTNTCHWAVESEESPTMLAAMEDLLCRTRRLVPSASNCRGVTLCV
ncbi:hypothetical protein AAFC00_003776 [Neodothiora populina]